MKKRLLALLLCASLMTGDLAFGPVSVVKAETTSDKTETTTVERTESSKKTNAVTATKKGATSTAGVIYANSREDFRDESIYFVMTTRFYDGDPSNNVQCWDGTQYDDPDDPEWRGDFKGLAEKLDYIKALGFTAIWITPVVENCSGYDYHGYHALNFKKVDPRYESDDFTYQDFIDAAHAKGLKVIQDVVFNHTGNFGETNLFPMIEKEGDLSSSDCMKVLPNSGLPDDYESLTPAQQYNARINIMKDDDGQVHDVNNIYHHEKSLGWEEYSCQTAQIAGDCVDLNTENPTVYKYLQDAYNQYIDMGVDAFRVDTAKHISRLTFNNALIEPFYKEAEKNGNDSFYMFGEVCTRDRDVWNKGVAPLSAPFYTWKESKNYPWSDTDRTVNEQSTLDNFNDNKNSTSDQPTSDNAFLNGNTYHTPDYSMNSGLGVIDFPMHWNFENANSAYGIALSGDKWYNDATWNVTYVDSHDYAPDQAPSDQRFAGSQDTWAENLSLMFTFRGIPCIYYGSEIEFQKGKPIDVGPNAALSDTGRAYFGDHIEGNVVATDFGEYYGATGTMKESLSYPLARHLQRLNRIRQAVPALRKGQYSTSDISGNMAFKRRYTDDKTDSFALVTISGSATFNNIPNGTYVDCVTGDTKTVTNGSLTANCSGKGNLRVYVLNTSKTQAPGKVGVDGKYLYTSSPVDYVDQDQTVYFRNTQGWNSVTANVYDANGKLVESIPMSAVNKEVYVCTYSGGQQNMKVVFTNGSQSSTKADLKDGGYYDSTGYKGQYTGDIVEVESVTLDQKEIAMNTGEKVKVNATVLPENAKNKGLSWTSSNPDVASVSNGTITGVGEGTTVITATAKNGVSASVSVTVKEVPYNYEKVEDGKLAIYFKKPGSWGTKINCYAYGSDNGTVTKLTGEWPGSNMELLPNGVYRYVMDEPTVSDVKVLFNDGGNQAPASGGFDVKAYALYDQSGYLKTIEPSDKKNLSVALSTSVASPQETGTAITLKADAEGGSGSYTYKFSVRDASGNVTGLQDYSANSSCVWTPDVAGKVTLCVEVKDSEDNVKKAEVSYEITKKETPTDELKVTLTTEGTSTITGNQVKLSAKATGGSGKYTYKFSVRSSEGNEFCIQNYSDKDNCIWYTGAIGKKTLSVEVKDSKGNVSKSSTSFEVKDKETSNLAVEFTISPSTTVSSGQQVTLSAKATGGSGEYTYKYIICSAEGNWFRIRDYASSNTCEWKPGATGKKTLYVDVKDSKGAYKRVALPVEVKNNLLSLNFTANPSSTAKSGQVVKLTGVASNGDGNYTYKFIICSADGNWFKIRDYSTDNTCNWTPGAAGNKTLYMDVKDGSGKYQRIALPFTVTNN